MMLNKVLHVCFYRTKGGHEPVREWLQSLDKESRYRIGTNIKTVEYGWPLGMPLCRGMGNGLYEVRINLLNTTARILFCIHDHHMVLLHGFIKKQQQTPKRELSLAKKRMKELIS